MLTALAVTAVVAALLLLEHWARLPLLRGDSDDALRLLRLRDLLAGEGWFDQRVDRIQPPEGGVIHWSRLLDGVMAGGLRGAQLAFGPEPGERLFRAAWPLLWLLPALGSLLVIARSLGGGRAVFICALCVTSATLAFSQFLPGRIDHHNIQIALAMVGLAGATAGGWRGGLAAGFAAAVGLAIGVEALIFHALVGAALALRWAFNPDEAPAARSYSLALAPTAAVLHGLQTLPAEWATPACDALGSNLIAALAIGAAGLLTAVAFLTGRGLLVRLGALGAMGLGAAAAYIGMEPACLGGPLGAVDTRLQPIWLDHVSEVQTLFQTVQREPARALLLFTPALVGLAVLAAALSRPTLRREPAWLIAGAFLLLATAAQAGGARMSSYAILAAFPVVAGGAARLIDARYGGRLLPALAAVLFLAPISTTAIAAAVGDRLWPEPPKADPVDRCLEVPSYRLLAGLPPGLVLADINLGSHLVALTPHSVLAAPYHRMDRGILQASALLTAPNEAAEGGARAAGVRYVVSCPAQGPGRARRLGTVGPAVLNDRLGPLQQQLDADLPPQWLDRLSPPGAALDVYAVRGVTPVAARMNPPGSASPVR